MFYVIGYNYCIISFVNNSFLLSAETLKTEKIVNIFDKIDDRL